MSLSQRIDEHMKQALRSKDAERLSALRMVKSELKRAEIDRNETLDEEAETQVLMRMAKQRRDSVEQFRAGGRDDLAQIEEAELKVLAEFLPEQLGEAEIDRAIDEALGEIGEPDMKQMGQIMGRVMGKLKATGKTFDGKAVNERVRRRLSGQDG